MAQSIVELLRQCSIERIFQTNVFSSCYPIWHQRINELTQARSPRQFLDLGDNLSNIFGTTREAGRGQADVSGGGAAWEALVCWYLNLCLIGHRTVVIKHNKNLIPCPVSDAITVNYGTFISNTESDLVAITFPNNADFNRDKDTLEVLDENRHQVRLYVGRENNQYNLLGVLNALCYHYFTDLEIHIIQCKTNWNDNAQIPMLWDMIYSANNFRANITIGKNGYSINGTRRFTYSFVTVPTSRVNGATSSSTMVKRVANLTGGNYWGKPSQNGVASSVKEMLQRNLASGSVQSHLTTLNNEIPHLDEMYSYFRI